MGVRWAVLVGGTGSNLEALIQKGISVELVVSHKRQVRALEIARRHHIWHETLLPASYADRDAYGQALRRLLDGAKIDAIALAGFMRWLDPLTVETYRNRIFNIHPSLLPAFSGLNAVAQALAYGVGWTGVTVHLVDEGEDSGPIVAQEPVKVQPGDTEASLAERIHRVEHRLYGEVLQAFEHERFAVNGRRVVWLS